MDVLVQFAELSTPIYLKKKKKKVQADEAEQTL